MYKGEDLVVHSIDGVMATCKRPGAGGNLTTRIYLDELAIVA